MQNSEVDMRIGEYQQVITGIKKSGNLVIAYLCLAHCTPCIKNEAINICKWFSDKYFTDDNFIIVKFKTKCGLGGWKMFKGKKRPFVALPTGRMFHPKKWKGKLRIGIVLHELAHAVSDLKYKKNCGHGKYFLLTYAEILNSYYNEFDKD